jgi:asparagine synthase (glutamine-hydrolysing)
MCGITGFLDLPPAGPHSDAKACILAMTATLAHRGPDDAGVWMDKESGVALGHRRLSILDLTPEGRQPMHSSSGRFVVVFNGEIYNFRELREDLCNSYRFRGSSDTEVILAAFERWGVRDAIEQFNGMFALAAWDVKHRVLYLARDRAGEKPLYYSWAGSTFLFGSELKALRAHRAFRGEIDRNALALFLRHSYVPTPYSIYSGVCKLPPGTILRLTRNYQGGESLSITYWSAKEVVERGRRATTQKTDGRDATDQLDHLLSDAIRLRMRSDVPVGAFLSGGVDSSAVVALMQKQSGASVRTFTIGFHEESYNEAVYARKIAGHLGTDHTELYLTSSEAASVIPRLPAMYDEPFADSSQIPTFLVSELARRHVIVSLSGDGADELFGGYTRYQWGERLWQKFGWIPVAARKIFARILLNISPRFWESSLGWIKVTRPADKIQKLAAVISHNTPEELYLGLVSHFNHPTELVAEAFEPPTLLTEPMHWPRDQDFLQRMMFLDMVTYLPDDILVKLDRASMAVGLEARVPFLDHRIIEFAWQLPLSMKIRHGQGKWVLRQVLNKYVPNALIDRPKCGFGVPLHQWLRGPLREWAEELLDGARLRREGYFDPVPINRQWAEHLSGKHNWMPQLWNVLMFQAWSEAQSPASTAHPRLMECLPSLG